MQATWPGPIAPPRARSRTASPRLRSIRRRRRPPGSFESFATAEGRMEWPAESPEACSAVCWAGRPPMNTEAYDRIVDNAFLAVADSPLSTFSDRRRHRLLRQRAPLPRAGTAPAEGRGAHRGADQLLPLRLPAPDGDAPFSVTHRGGRRARGSRSTAGAASACRAADRRARPLPPSNLVFLSTCPARWPAANKLPLLKEALGLLVDQLTEQDRVAIVVYAGASGLSCRRRPGDRKGEIRDALDRLEAGGSTAGGAGIQLAYQVARESFIAGRHQPRHPRHRRRLQRRRLQRRRALAAHRGEAQDRASPSPCSASAMGNLKDATMEMLADKGNGNYCYIDTLNEARKVLVARRAATLVTIAKDVKLQVEFNPATVAAYRLIGYENRVLRRRGLQRRHQGRRRDRRRPQRHRALRGRARGREGATRRGVDPLKYQEPPTASAAPASGELLTVKLRYKQPEGDTSRLLAESVKDGAAGDGAGHPLRRRRGRLRHAAARLRAQGHRHASRMCSSWPGPARARTRAGYRAEFLRLVETAEGLVPCGRPRIGG